MANNHHHMESSSMMMVNNVENTLSKQQSITSTSTATTSKMKRSITDKSIDQPVNIVINFLDESKTVFQIHQKALAKDLFYQVCESLNLIELDYFGLEYYDKNMIQYWLDLERPIHRQLSLSMDNLNMNFAVKFYTTEPSKLEDELTRYLFALQIKKDLASGDLICNDNTAALLSAYAIQAECGDFNPNDYNDHHHYISQFKLISNQDDDFEFKVMENHKKLIDLSPAEADLQLLEIAKELEMYGVKLSSVKDHEGVPLNLAVVHHGILIFQNYTKVNTFDWIKIRKLSFKRKRFFIKLHQEEFFGDVLEFVFQHRNECKNFWKKCIEQHSFFKCIEIKQKTRKKIRIFSRGSSFRYTGRTQQQISEFIKTNNSINQQQQRSFQRSNSMKFNSLQKDPHHHHDIGYNVDNNKMVNQNSDNSSIINTCNNNNNNHNSNHNVNNHTSSSSTTTMTTNAIKMVNYHKSCDTIDQQSVFQNHDEPSLLLSSQPFIDTFHQTLNLSSVNLNSTLEFRGFKRRMNQDYYVFRDLVMSERTYLKDLESMRDWFKNDVSKEPSRSAEMLSLLVNVSEPLIDFHEKFLHDIEYILFIWDKNGFDSLPPLSTVLNEILKWMSHYEQIIERLPFILERINSNFCSNKEFESICREFETKKGCYLPYTSFLLKPAFHPSFYAKIIQKLIDCYCANHCDYLNLKRLVEQLNNFNHEYANTLDSLINLVILIELQRDIAGFVNIVQSGRRFIREGCLLKLSKKGFQQRLFFLFSDLLIYASRSTYINFQFKIHGYFSLYNVFVEETESKFGQNYCFTIYVGNKILILAAGLESDRQSWIRAIKESAIVLSTQPSSSILPSNDLLDKIDSALSEHLKNLNDHHISHTTISTMNNNGKNGDHYGVGDNNNTQSRTNTIIHVCWQRNCTITSADYRYALTVSFSGYLLRKFKNSSGWQKLWVEFTHFCLFFYKSAEDNYPLASLPVIGYTVSIPSDADNMSKNYVFKLQFKKHVYFFRAESEYAFNKWMEVIKKTTSTSIAAIMPTTTTTIATPIIDNSSSVVQLN
ncbi:chondrocyte-derived ezrin-like domain containing protein [Dermatophagoides farinae]|uniref:chondrocyte-derived ezrin-like domain containing protein n=1 Tax=Dermatophagoides farinae TaxID=6954 RepID=UPI003F6471CA